QVGKVKPRTEMPPLAAQRQQPRTAVSGPRDGGEQRLDQPRVERVGLVRPVEDKLDHRARLLDQKGIGHRGSHGKARLFGGGTCAPGRPADHSAITSCVWAPSSGGEREISYSHPEMAPGKPTVRGATPWGSPRRR